jgi:hypothetical protein
VTSATSSDPAGRRPRYLIVRPAPAAGGANGGDEVIYKRSIAYLKRDADTELFELQPVGKARQIFEIFRGAPPEATRFTGGDNAERLAAVLAGSQFDAVCLFNEVTFSYTGQVKAAGLPVVLIAQNVHSLVAATDPSAVARLLRPMAVAFERRFYADPQIALVCISRADVEGLKAAGIERTRDLWIAPAGAPPAKPLSPDAPILREAVLTGSYGWWRKRRDLKSFAAGEPLGAPVLASDPLALEILGEEGRQVEASEVDWSAGLRFGLITDAFVGGFKLKSLEYIANNCVVLSMSDIAIEYEGIPHAEEFMRITPTKADARRAIEAILAQPHQGVIERFLEFKAACMARYEWEACLKPLGDAVASRLPATGLMENVA